ncbi:MAG: coproporphyrinogen-III oxidase family protein [bacterium]
MRLPPTPGTPLGLYLHIPFCRKRCRFCYFKVYTDKNSADIRRYVEALQKELSLYADKPFAGGRPVDFIYFGGGTPSYLSVKQLQELTDRLKQFRSWDETREVAFECEPGTLSGEKLNVIREIGVTRLSLGVENFNDQILELNGRAHRSPEIFKTYEQARTLGFPQINIDLISGMVGETEGNWQACVEKVLELAPDIITIYQMEVPFNTIIHQEMEHEGRTVAPVADWITKRRWVQEAFERLESAGYTISSAYSAVKKGINAEFLYRDYLWEGADLLGLGVASFSHINGTHFQNEKDFVPYLEAVEEGRFPIRRALALSEEEKLIREMILQLKRGSVRRQYFTNKFHIDILDRFSVPLRNLERENYLEIREDSVQLTRRGLLEVDSLLPNFYLPQHRNARYT